MNNNSSRLFQIEGPDGSGKSSLTKQLRYCLMKNGIKNVETIHFPNYESESSYFVREYLKGNYGERKDINKEMVAHFYLYDMYDAYIKKIKPHVENNGVMIMDRYTDSIINYQLEGDMRDENLKNFKSIMYNILPIPEYNIILIPPLQVMINRLNKKHKQDESTKDIHENDYKFIEYVRDQYVGDTIEGLKRNSILTPLNKVKYNNVFKVIETDEKTEYVEQNIIIIRDDNYTKEIEDAYNDNESIINIVEKCIFKNERLC